MPGVAILTPTFAGPGLISSHSDKSHFYPPDNTRTDHKPPPDMHDVSLTTINDLTVAEIKEKAKEDVRRAAKGVSAITLIKSARTQSQQACIYENQGDLKAALGAFLRAGILTHMFMHSAEVMAETKPGRHGVLYKEFVDFERTDGSNLTQRVQAIEAKLTDLEKSSATNDNIDAGPSRQVGPSIADRVKKLNDAGLAVDTSKRISREFPIAPSTPLSIPLRSPEPIRSHKLSPTLVSPPPPPPPPFPVIVPPSNNGSTASSPHVVVPPSSLGPPSPTSSESSFSPHVHSTAAEFSQTFPSIDELDEFASRFPSVPEPEPTGSSSITYHSSISQSNSPHGVEALNSSHSKQFPSLSIDPGPRPSSTPITPTMNAFISRPASPTISLKPSINNLASSPLSTKTSSVPEKTGIQGPNTIRPELLHEYLDASGLKTLVVDIRTREDFDIEHIKADAIVCLEPSVLARPSVTAASLEDSLVVAPREEWVLFQNRDKFDLVVLYDASSETHDAAGPLSAFVQAVFTGAYRKFLRHTPVLLEGGFHAWKQMFSDEVVRAVPGGTRASPNSILENGISSTSGAILSSASIPDVSRNRLLLGSPRTNGVLTEKRHPEASPLLPGKTSEIDTTPDGPASSLRRQAKSEPPSMSHSHSQSESISQSSRPAIYSFSNNTTHSASITYPSIASTSTPGSSTSSFSQTPSTFTPVSLPPQASINPSPLARRRSDYMNGSGFTHRPSSIDYPDLHVIRPPPPAASPVSERQDSRPHLQHSSSYSVSVPYTSKAGPKPPTIQSDYPVVYWSDLQLNTTGLKNLGNTCYMNATIQCLSATVPFARFFTDGRWKNAVNMLNPLGTKGILAGAFAMILYEMSHSELPYFTPFMFRKSICSYAAQFGGADQHDSQEFLTFLLDALHEDLNRVLTKPNNETSPEREAELEKLPQQIASEQEWEIYRMRNDSVIVDYFQGQFRNRMECLTCHHTSTTYNSFMYLSLPIPSIRGPSKVSLSSCLDAFVKEEVLEKSEAWHCPKCKTLRSASKILTLSRLPPVLLIHLKRFSVKGHFTDKIETVVDFPLKSLDLTNYMPPPLPPDMRKSVDRPTLTSSVASDPRVQVPPYKYDLYGVTNHFGSLSNGHYTAFVASRRGWLYCDDSRITQIDAKEVVGRPAYVLYYRRVKS